MDKVFLLHHEYARNGELEHKITVYGALAKVKEEYVKLVKAIEKSYICEVYLNSDLFSEVKWENEEPMEVEVTIKLK